MFLAACGGGTPSMQVTLDSSSAGVVRGGAVQIEATVSRPVGDTSVIDLAVEGLPAGLTATFAPATLAATDTASVLTLEAATSAVEGTYDLLVRADGGSLAATAELTLTITSLNVSGRVLSYNDFPAHGVEVRSQGVSTVTDDSGAFSLAGLSSPYDVTVWSTAEDWLHVFEGVTTNQPVLTVLHAPSVAGPIRGTTIGGMLSGGQIPVGANQAVAVCVSSAVPMATPCDTLITGESTYSISLQWLGDASLPADIHALQFQTDGAGYPVSYLGYSSMSLTLRDGLPVVAHRDLGGPLETVEVQVDIESEDLATATFGAVQLDPNLALTVMAAINTDVSHTAIMPVLADATYTFAAGTSPDQFGWQANVTGEATTVQVPAAVVHETPADLATGIGESTVFRVSSVPGAQTTFVWEQSGGGPHMAITTMSDSVTMPSLADHSLALPESTDFEWNVLTTSADEVGADSSGFRTQFVFALLLGTRISPGLEGSGWLSATDWRTFTTAP